MATFLQSKTRMENKLRESVLRERRFAMKALLGLLAATLAVAAAQATDEIPFETKAETRTPFADGLILGKKATHTQAGAIDVHSVIVGVAPSFDQAEAMCRSFKAGKAQWSLPTLLTFYGIAMAGGGATAIETLNDEANESSGHSVWITGKNDAENKELKGTRKFLYLGSAFRTELTDLNEVEEELSKLVKSVPKEELAKAEEALQKAKTGLPVLCVSKNLKED